MVKVCAGEVVLEIPPLVNVEVTETIAINGSDVIFWAVNWLIIPVPSSVWVKPTSSPEAIQS